MWRYYTNAPNNRVKCNECGKTLKYSLLNMETHYISTHRNIQIDRSKLDPREVSKKSKVTIKKQGKTENAKVIRSRYFNLKKSLDKVKAIKKPQEKKAQSKDDSLVDVMNLVQDTIENLTKRLEIIEKQVHEMNSKKNQSEKAVQFSGISEQKKK